MLNNGGGGIIGGPGGRAAPIIIRARAFSAAAAAAMRLLFSRSLNKGDRNKKEGSIPGSIDPYPSLEKMKSFNKGLLILDSGNFKI